MKVTLQLSAAQHGGPWHCRHLTPFARVGVLSSSLILFKLILLKKKERKKEMLFKIQKFLVFQANSHLWEFT